ncbi:MAG: cyclic nucleotide-binding domain-containing protein [Betaproteobacteria bacterium]
MIDARDLENISLFEGLTVAERDVVASVMTRDTFPEGHIVYRENEAGCACIYIVRKGKVDVTRMNTDSNPLPLTVLKEGHFFGELSFFDFKPHSATTVVSAPDTTVLSLHRPDFDRVVEGHPVIGYKVLINIIHEVSSVIRKMNESYINMTDYMFGHTKR